MLLCLARLVRNTAPSPVEFLPFSPRIRRIGDLWGACAYSALTVEIGLGKWWSPWSSVFFPFCEAFRVYLVVPWLLLCNEHVIVRGSINFTLCDGTSTDGPQCYDITIYYAITHVGHDIMRLPRHLLFMHCSLVFNVWSDLQSWCYCITDGDRVWGWGLEWQGYCNLVLNCVGVCFLFTHQSVLKVFGTWCCGYTTLVQVLLLWYGSLILICHVHEMMNKGESSLIPCLCYVR